MSFKRSTVFIMIPVFLAGMTGDVRSQGLSGSTPVMPVSVPSPVLQGLRIFPEDPFRMDFIVDAADAASDDPESAVGAEGSLQLNSSLRSESMRLVKYFLAALTIPEDDLWVNLSPTEPDRIIPETLARTEMGRAMLEQDYVLKQLSASLMNPNGEAGKSFWEKIYSAVYAETGDSPQGTVPSLETLNKIWIIPDVAEVYVQGDYVFITRTRMKVMLDAERSDMQNTIRQIILPVIEKEINEGEAFAPLRQMYHSLILAAWFKTQMKQSLLNRVYTDRSQVNGIDDVNADETFDVYRKYLEAFQRGAGVIREEYDPATQQIIARQYMTGGIVNKAQRVLTFADSAMLPEGWQSVEVRLDAAMMNAGVQIENEKVFQLFGSLVKLRKPFLYYSDSNNQQYYADRVTLEDGRWYLQVYRDGAEDLIIPGSEDLENHIKPFTFFDEKKRIITEAFPLDADALRSSSQTREFYGRWIYAVKIYESLMKAFDIPDYKKYLASKFLPDGFFEWKDGIEWWLNNKTLTHEQISKYQGSELFWKVQTIKPLSKAKDASFKKAAQWLGSIDVKDYWLFIKFGLPISVKNYLLVKSGYFYDDPEFMMRVIKTQQRWEDLERKIEERLSAIPDAPENIQSVLRKDFSLIVAPWGNTLNDPVWNLEDSMITGYLLRLWFEISSQNRFVVITSWMEGFVFPFFIETFPFYLRHRFDIFLGNGNIRWRFGETGLELIENFSLKNKLMPEDYRSIEGFVYSLATKYGVKAHDHRINLMLDSEDEDILTGIAGELRSFREEKGIPFAISRTKSAVIISVWNKAEALKAFQGPMIVMGQSKADWKMLNQAAEDERNIVFWLGSKDDPVVSILNPKIHILDLGNPAQGAAAILKQIYLNNKDRPQLVKTDAAMNAAPVNEPGGINFRLSGVPVSETGKSSLAPLYSAQLSDLPVVHGLTPVILGVHPFDPQASGLQ